MDTEQLSAALRAATATIDAPPGFTEKVRHGARRRVVRRRYRACAAVLAVLAIAGVLAALSAYRKPEVSTTHPNTGANATGALPSDDPRLHEATKGDFAQNQSFRDQVVVVWRQSRHVPLDGHQESGGSSAYTFGPVGPVNVYWAGSTFDGPAAVLLQTFRFQPTEGGLRPVTIVRIGLVADASKAGTLRVEGEQTVGEIDTTESDESFAFGTNYTSVLTMAESGFHVYSAAPVVDAGTGKVSRQWEDLPYVDGVAVVDLSAELGTGHTMVELPRRPDATHSSLPSAGPAVHSPYQPTSGSDPAWITDPRLTWPIETVAGTAPCGMDTAHLPQLSTVFDPALHNGGYGDPYVGRPATAGTPGVPGDSESHWHIGCRLANGNLLILGEELVGTVGRLYAVTSDRDGRVVSVAYGGPIDPDSELPVRYELPDGSGWLVAAYGSRLSSGHVSGNDVLPVPKGPNTASVTVTPPAGGPTSIDLVP